MMLVIRMLSNDVALYIFLLLSENKWMPEIRVTNRATRTRRKTMLFDTIITTCLFTTLYFLDCQSESYTILNYVKKS